MSDARSISNMTTRGTAQRHDDEQGREEVERFKTSSDDSNLMRGKVRTRNDEEIGDGTKKPKLMSLNPCNVDIQNVEEQACGKTTRSL